MDQEDFDGIVQGLREVARYRRGEREGFVVHAPDQVDVASIRRRHNQTQAAFARTYGFSLSAVRDWEQGRRRPERAARLLLAMISSEPQTVKRVLERIG